MTDPKPIDLDGPPLCPECGEPMDRSLSTVRSESERPRAALDAVLDRAVHGAKAAERARIVAWLRTYDEATYHDAAARQLATRIERGQHEEDGNG